MVKFSHSFMPGHGHKNPQATCSSWIYYVFLTARASLTFRSLPPGESLCSYCFCSCHEGSLAGELCAAEEAGYTQRLVSSLVVFPLLPGSSTLSALREWGDKISWRPSFRGSLVPLAILRYFSSTKWPLPATQTMVFIMGFGVVSHPVTSEDEPFSSARQ